MRISVLGAAGQLGSDLSSELEPRTDVLLVRLTRADADAADAVAITRALEAAAPDVVINTVAYNRVDDAEDDPAAAFAGNAFTALNVARACARLDAKLVHVSSDYVFGADAARNTPYDESDPPAPISVYGCSKLAGEQLARVYAPGCLVVRTTGLFGLGVVKRTTEGGGKPGGNFIESMLRLARERPTLRVVDDQVLSPTATRDLAPAVLALVDAGATGIVHVTSMGKCSWFELAKRALEIAGIDTPIEPITSTEFGARAKRPAYSVLGHRALREAGVPEPPHWSDALAEYLRDRASLGLAP